MTASVTKYKIVAPTESASGTRFSQHNISIHLDLACDTSAQQRPGQPDAKNDPDYDQGKPGEKKRTITVENPVVPKHSDQSAEHARA